MNVLNYSIFFRKMSPCEDKKESTFCWVTVDEYNRQRRSGCGFMCVSGEYTGMICNDIIHNAETHMCNIHNFLIPLENKQEIRPVQDYEWISVEEYDRQGRIGCGLTCQFGDYANMMCNGVIYDHVSHLCDLHYLTTFVHED